MASRMGLIGGLIIVAALLKGATAADTYVVGGSMGWEVPPLGAVAYTTWAATESFDVGDTLMFNWTGTHNVVKVSKADFDNCTAANSNSSIISTSPANIIISSNETQYYICTVGTHCTLGQKLTITVESESGSGSGSGSSAASSLTVGALSAVLLTIVISFLSYM